MSSVLSISNKLMSFRGRMLINDDREQALYEACGEFALFCPTWTVSKQGNIVATIKSKFWSWSPTWIIKSDFGDFIIKRKLLSWVRNYQVIGGNYDGATIIGNFWDLKFNISHNGKCLASAKGKIMSIRDTHNIHVHGDDNDELFTTIVMVALHLDRKNEQSSASNSD